MGDLMGDILGDNGSPITDGKADENIVTSTVDDVLSDNSPADSFDTDIDEILADIVDNQGETDGIDLVDFDENSSDIESILFDMSGDLAASPEITAVTESLVEPEITSDIENHDLSDIDSLVNEITGAGDLQEPTDVADDLSTDQSSTAEVSDIMDMLSDDLENDNTTLLPEVEAPDTLESEDTLSELDGLLADISEDDAIIPTEAEEPSTAEEIDPDIALVKSLMADLSAKPSFDDANDLTALIDDNDHEGEASESEMLENNAVESDVAESDMDDILASVLDDTHDVNDDVLQAEGDLIGDLLDDTIKAEEQLQETINKDIEAQIAELSDALEEESRHPEPTPATSPETSGLAHLADKIQKSDGVGVGAVAMGASGAAVAGASIAAAIASNNNSRKSALEALMDGLEGSDAEIAEASGAISVDDFSSVTDSPEGNQLLELVNDETHDDLGVAIELGTELAVPELDIPELDLPELNLVDEILEDGADQVVAVTPETVQTKIETSQTETEDMAGKTARDTILDEVTETAAASAFASLNQVVDEKNIVAERGDRIGDLVSEALKPMLKDWLDANLKTIVERAVTKEVKRISSGK